MKKELITQQSWAGGQINKAAWRRDDLKEFRSASKRQENWRVEATEQPVPRPGRSLFAPTLGKRVEPVRIAGIDFLICFGAGLVQVINRATGLQAALNVSGTYLWDATTLGQIVWTQAVNDTVICFPGMQPQIVRYDPLAATWTFLAYSFRTISNQKQAPFVRQTALGATMTYTQPLTASGVGGGGQVPVLNATALPIACSAPYFNNAMINSVLSFMGQQATIKTVTDPTHATVDVAYVLPAPVSCLVKDTSMFIAGQEANFKLQGLKIEIGSVQPGVGAASPGGTIVGTLMSSAIYPGASTITGEQLISPLGTADVTFGPNTAGNCVTVAWMEEFMSAIKGWPRSCFFDKGRLGFCDFPQRQSAILWCSIDNPDMAWADASAARLYPQAGTQATNAILEFVPPDKRLGSPRVFYVAGWDDQFVFTDRGIYRVPISETNPLKPGSVAFHKVSNDGVAQIPPVDTVDALVYINAGKRRVSAVKAASISQSARPFITDDVSEPHSDLFTSPRAMTISTGDGSKPERYVYVLNDDGTLVVGKFTADRQFVGWAPWTSGAPAEWIGAAGPDVFHTVNHGAAADWIEIEDTTRYLDSSLTVNALPAQIVPPLGKGPLWYIPGATVTLMDGLRDLGDYVVDANGNIVPNQPGEVLTSATIVAGLKFTATLVPLVPMAGAGESIGQRQHRRKVAMLMVSFQQSSGFKIGKRELPAYKFNDDALLPPPLRDGSEFIRPIGRFYDPYNAAVIKDRPGPLRIIEISQDVTV